jgi:hypothetical protein
MRDSQPCYQNREKNLKPAYKHESHLHGKLTGHVHQMVKYHDDVQLSMGRDEERTKLEMTKKELAQAVVHMNALKAADSAQEQSLPDDKKVPACFCSVWPTSAHSLIHTDWWSFSFAC